MTLPGRLSLNLLALVACPLAVLAQAPAVPDWAQPGSATHKQVPPPPNFHRPTRTLLDPIGVFTGQSDIGGAVVPGQSAFDPATGAYTIRSAGYNIWYTRDEFRYLWNRVEGDVRLAADISFPNASGYGDRKVVLVVRQDLDDDSKEAMVGLHGAGLIHLAGRPEKGANITEACRVEAAGVAPGERLGIEKHGDTFTLLVSLKGEPLHPAGAPLSLHVDGPFYVGIGFCSHLPATVDSGVVSHVTLETGDLPPLATTFDAASDAALAAMAEHAAKLKTTGVGVVAYFTGAPIEGWTSKMRVMGSYKALPTEKDKGYNLLAIAYSKAAEMADLLRDSGSGARAPYVGEFGWQGGVIAPARSGYVIAAFSGGKSEDDAAIARAGLQILTSAY